MGINYQMQLKKCTTLKNNNTPRIEETFNEIYDEIIDDETFPQREKLLLRLAKWS